MRIPNLKIYNKQRKNMYTIVSLLMNFPLNLSVSSWKTVTIIYALRKLSCKNFLTIITLENTFNVIIYVLQTHHVSGKIRCDLKQNTYTKLFKPYLRT